ncbi:MAG: tetratricopeptide repeat protein [Micropruina sp.]
MTDHWYETLRRTMDAATGQPQPPSELIREALGAARSCDPRSEDEVVQALVELSRLAWHGVAASDPAADEVMLAAADLALAAYLEGGLNGPLRGVAREWHRRGRTAQAINLLDESRRLAAEHGVGAEPRAAVATLHGDLLRQHGELDAAEVALLDALAEVGAVSGVDPALVSTLLNNLGLVRQERGDLTQALADLIASLEVDGLEQDAGSLAVTLDNLGRLETELARRAGPLWIDADLVNGVTDEHLRRAEEYFVRATELFQEGLPETAEDYVICLLNRADAAELRADEAQRDRLSSTALEEALRLPVSAATAWSVAALRGEVLLDRGRPDEAAQLMGRWFTHLAPTVSMGVAQAAGLAMLVTAAAVAGDDELAGRVAADLAGLDSWLLEGLLASGSQAEIRHRFRSFAQRAELVLGACLPREPSGIAADWLYELVLNRKGLLAERRDPRGCTLAGRRSPVAHCSRRSGGCVPTWRTWIWAAISPARSARRDSVTNGPNAPSTTPRRACSATGRTGSGCPGSVSTTSVLGWAAASSCWRSPPCAGRAGSAGTWCSTSVPPGRSATATWVRWARWTAGCAR